MLRQTEQIDSKSCPDPPPAPAIEINAAEDCVEPDEFVQLRAIPQSLSPGPPEIWPLIFRPGKFGGFRWAHQLRRQAPGQSGEKWHGPAACGRGEFQENHRLI